MPNQTLKQSHNAHTQNDTTSTDVLGVYGEVETKLEAPECHLEIENVRFSYLNNTLMKGRRFQQKGFKKFILTVQVRTRLNSASENKHAYHFGNSNQYHQRLCAPGCWIKSSTYISSNDI